AERPRRARADPRGGGARGARERRRALAPGSGREGNPEAETALMSVLERLKGLFGRDEIPDEAKRVFDRAQTPRELLRGLDELLTTNEVEFKELERELEKTEGKEREEMARIR